MKNESSEAANRASLAIRKIPLGFASIMMAAFGKDEADIEECEQMIVDRIAHIIESETHCGVLLMIAEEAEKYAGSTTDCCMGGDRTSELCGLHQALMKWKDQEIERTKNGQEKI